MISNVCFCAIYFFTCTMDYPPCDLSPKVWGIRQGGVDVVCFQLGLWRHHLKKRRHGGLSGCDGLSSVLGKASAASVWLGERWWTSAGMDWMIHCWWIWWWLNLDPIWSNGLSVLVISIPLIVVLYSCCRQLSAVRCDSGMSGIFRVLDRMFVV